MSFRFKNMRPSDLQSKQSLNLRNIKFNIHVQVRFSFGFSSRDHIPE